MADFAGGSYGSRIYIYISIARLAVNLSLRLDNASLSGQLFGGPGPHHGRQGLPPAMVGHIPHHGLGSYGAEGPKPP